MRRIRNRLARIAALVALLIALSLASSAPALGWGGEGFDTLDGAQSIDDGGVPQPE